MSGRTDLLRDQLGDLLDELVERHAADAVRELWDRQREAAPVVEGSLRLSKAAEALDVSVSTIRRLVEAGELESIEVAGMAHVRTAEIARYLDDRTAQARRRQLADQARAARRRRGRATA